MVLPFFNFNVSGQHTEDKKQRQTDRIPYFFITAFLLLPESDGSGMHKFDPAPQTLLLVLLMSKPLAISLRLRRNIHRKPEEGNVL
jgi:hypothetical protein